MNPIQQKILDVLKAKGVSEQTILIVLTDVAQSVTEHLLISIAEELSSKDTETFVALLDSASKNPEALDSFIAEKIPDFDSKAEKLTNEIAGIYLSAIDR